MTDIRTNEVTPPATLPDPSPSDPLEALSWLGGTVEEIAEGLRARGIKGRKYSPGACPLANYLRLWFKGPDVGGFTFGVEGHVFPLPPPCGRFVGQFDGRNYPDLIDDDV